MKPAFDRELFERAFSMHSSGVHRMCACGVRFYHCDGSNVWEHGELEALQADPNAVSLPYLVLSLNIEGKEYVADCNCWVDRAKAITEWLDRNGIQIAAWYNLRKQHAVRQAANMPEVKS